MKTLKTLFLASALAGFVLTTQAQTVVDISTSGHFASNTTTNAPAVSRSLDRVNVNQVNPSDPSTWTVPVGSWTNDLQASLISGSNSKIGWVAYDLGSEVSSLDTFYIWNCSENTAGNRDVQDFNIYYASSPSVSLASNADYDFTSTGWTKLNATTLTMAQLTGTSGPQASISLGNIAAQYIAIEVISNYGDGGRWGISEVALTAVPEASTFALIGLTGMALFIRRRR